MEHSAPEVVPGQHFSQGLHTVRDHNDAPEVWHGPPPSVSTSSSFVGDEKFLRVEAAAPAPKKPAFWHRRRLIIAAVVGSAILLAAILGGALGSRALANGKVATSASTNVSSTSSPTATTAPDSISKPPPAATPMQRVRSTKGAWNGTGMTCYQSTVKDFWGSLVYQDYTGQITEVHWNYSKSDSSIVSTGTKQVTDNAANNTNLALAAYDQGGWWKFHMVYVNQDNMLSDLWSSSRALNSPWTDGNLSTHNFKSATNTTPAMSMLMSDKWYTDSYGPPGVRLWAGAPDGKLHQYTLFQDNSSWSNNDFVLPDSYGYGAVVTNGGYSANLQPNTTVWSSLPDGTLQAATSADGVNSSQGNTTTGPDGKWSAQARSSLKAAVNGSVVPWWGNVGGDVNPGWGKDLLGLIYEGADGKLDSVSLDESKDDASQFVSTNDWLKQYDIMPGSQFATCGGDDYTQVIFYQSKGDEISWLVVSQTEYRNSGTLRLFR